MYYNIIVTIVFVTNMLCNPLVKSLQPFTLKKISSKQFIMSHDMDPCIEKSIRHKKIISISPGGFKGFYQFGVCKFIKEHYNLDNYVFSGASAGAWNSLALCYKGDHKNIQDVLLAEDTQKVKTIKELKDMVRHKILSNFKSEDFELDRLFVGTTAIENYQRKTIIYGGFDNLEDAVNCCIASSHIPLVTGGLHNYYRNVAHYDGGFSKHPYLDDKDIVIHIKPDIWKKDKKEKSHIFKITDYTTLFSRHNFSFKDMIDAGYQDSKNNKEILDSIFGKSSSDIM